MTPMFEELAWEQTPIGELVLRRRRLTSGGEDIWEIKLNDGYLMSSQFVDGEIALADLALAMTGGEGLNVVVGGLGLGYTGKVMADDPRCVLRQGDFFALALEPDGFDPAAPDQLHDAILIDIDHSTTHFIADTSAGFYSEAAIAAITAKLKPGGVFALWSTDAEDAAFVTALGQSLNDVCIERVEFPTPYRDQPAFNLIYLGRKPV